MIKVLQLHFGRHPLPYEGAGGDNCILEIAKAVSKVPGCQATLVELRSSVTGDGKDTVPLIEVFNPGIRSDAFIGHVVKALSYALSATIVAVRNARRFDIVHCHGQITAAMVIACKRLLKLPFKVVYTLHNAAILEPDKFGRQNWFLEPYVLRHADHVIAVTPAVEQFLVAKMGVPAERISQIYLGAINCRKELPAGNASRPAEPVIICVASICQRKNQRALVKALPSVFRDVPAARCVFIGLWEDPAYLEELRDMARQNGIEDRLSFLGGATRSRMSEELARARVSVILSSSETQGLALIEAMSFGLPVVASPIAPFQTVISQEPGSALVVNPGDTEAVATALKRLLTDDALHKTMSERALSLAGRFSWDAIGPVIVETYRKILTIRGA